jgi:hypothetical protein
MSVAFTPNLVEIGEESRSFCFLTLLFSRQGIPESRKSDREKRAGMQIFGRQCRKLLMDGSAGLFQFGDGVRSLASVWPRGRSRHPRRVCGRLPLPAGYTSAGQALRVAPKCRVVQIALVLKALTTLCMQSRLKKSGVNLDNVTECHTFAR